MKFVDCVTFRDRYSRYSLIIALVGVSVGLSSCQSDAGSSGSGSGGIPLTEATPKPTAPPGSTPSPNPTATPVATPKPTATPAPTGALFTGPAELTKYVVKFIDDAKADGMDVRSRFGASKITIQIASLKSVGAYTIGLCSSGGGRRIVTFDTTFWNSVDDVRRETLVNHELGHCILNRGHTSAKLSTGEYASIMTPYILSRATYLAHYTYYINELFSNAPKFASDLNENGADDPVDYICNGDHDGGEIVLPNQGSELP